jgi:carbamoyl-phosphate synthase small subunit
MSPSSGRSISSAEDLPAFVLIASGGSQFAFLSLRRKNRPAEQNGSIFDACYADRLRPHFFQSEKQDSMKQAPAVLLLADGTAFHGKAVGMTGTTTGEICFNTGMTGYQEIFTDPSYYRQIMVMTTAHIGNYGARLTETESEGVKIAGLVCKNFTASHFSRIMATSSLQDLFEEERLVGISDVDTRAIVRHIRSKGAMNAIISSEILDLDVLREKLAEVPDMGGLELASAVTTRQPYMLGNSDAKFRVAVLDLGVKRNILNCMVDRGCYLKVFPARTPFAELKKWEPDGYFLSNGPGDPAPMDYATETAAQILRENAPLFGICLGHQILAQALGIPTYKMHHGHRGINHPVKNLKTGRCEITSQNHGFAVNADEIARRQDIVEVTHVNLNDDTIEGIRARKHQAFSVQYHPEASPGPHDARYLFDDFINMMQQSRRSVVRV